MFSPNRRFAAPLAVLVAALSLALPAAALAGKSSRDSGLTKAQQLKADHDPSFFGIGRKVH